MGAWDIVRFTRIPGSEAPRAQILSVGPGTPDTRRPQACAQEALSWRGHPADGRVRRGLPATTSVQGSESGTRVSGKHRLCVCMWRTCGGRAVRTARTRTSMETRAHVCTWGHTRVLCAHASVHVCHGSGRREGGMAGWSCTRVLRGPGSASVGTPGPCLCKGPLAPYTAHSDGQLSSESGLQAQMLLETPAPLFSGLGMLEPK